MMKTITLSIRFVNLHIALALLGLNAVPARGECVDDGVACGWVFGVGTVAELETNSGTSHPDPRKGIIKHHIKTK